MFTDLNPQVQVLQRHLSLNYFHNRDAHMHTLSSGYRKETYFILFLNYNFFSSTMNISTKIIFKYSQVF
jgi:hypothetical protein